MMPAASNEEITKKTESSTKSEEHKEKSTLPPDLKCGNYLFTSRRTYKPKKRKQPTLSELREKIKMADHYISLKVLERRLETNLQKGLRIDQIKDFLKRDGPNILSLPRARFSLDQVTCHWQNVSVPILVAIVLSFVSAALPQSQWKGSYVMDDVYLGAILVGALLLIWGYSYFVERKCRKIMRSFRSQYPQYANLIRGGVRCKVFTKEIVVGDIVVLKTGDMVPADVRIVDSRDFTTDDSRITGIREPSSKNHTKVFRDPFQTKNVAFYGTYCLSGQARGIVIATGNRTVWGRMKSSMVAYERPRTPLYQELKRIVCIFSLVKVAMGAILAVVACTTFRPGIDVFLYLLVVLIASMPEMLLSAVTMNLAVSAKRMSRKQCLVKDLETVEQLGSTSVILCSQEGFITQYILIIRSLYLDGTPFLIDEPPNKSNVRFNLISSNSWNIIVRAMCLCNTVTKEEPAESPAVLKSIDDNRNPLDYAIMVMLKSHGVEWSDIQQAHVKLFENYSTDDNRYHVTMHEYIPENDSQSSYYVATVKGDPDVLRPLCSRILNDGRDQQLGDEEWQEILRVREEFAKIGEELIGFCDLEIPKSAFQTNAEDILGNISLKNMRFLGMLSVLEPIRPSSVEAVRNCRNAGIKVILLSDDHISLAKSVARKAGIIATGHETRTELAKRLNIGIKDVEPNSVPAVVLDRRSLDAMPVDDLRRLLTEYDELVFSKISVEQKLRLVRLFREQGHSVVLTGRCTQASELFKKAERENVLRIAMGISSCDICKDVADVILLDNSFSTAVNGIKEGRLIFDNLRKATCYLLTCKIAETLPFFMFLILRYPLPLGTVHIIFIFFGAELFPALCLLEEKAESNIMHRTPNALKGRNLINLKLIQASYLTVGVTVAMAGVFAYVVIMAENGFTPTHLYGIRNAWYSPAVNDLEDSFGQEWTFSARKNLEHFAQTGFFVTVIVVQWFTIAMCRSTRDSLFTFGLKNYILILTILSAAALSVMVCYIPGMSYVLHTTPLKFTWWLLGIPFGLFLFGYDEVRQFIIRHSSEDAWVTKETY